MTIIALIGQILLGGFFIYNGFGHLKNLNALTGYAVSKNVPQAKFAVMFTGLMLLVGGLSILTGFMVEIGAWILVLFLAVTTSMMHQFWKSTDPMHKMSEQVQFAKNIALIGALLMIVVGK